MVAPTGHTSSHGAFSHCMQGTGCQLVWLASRVSYRSTRIQCMIRPIATCSRPTTGMLFSAWQAMVQALQPMHASRSTTMAQACSG